MIYVPKTALILAGGLGTRLRSVVADRPKVLATAAGRPFLAHLLDQLASAGVRRAVICTGYRGEMVAEAFGDRHGGLSLFYSHESQPLGTGGALRAALPLVDGDSILVMNGDSYCRADLAALAEAHAKQNAAATLLLTHVDDASRFGRVETDDSGRVLEFLEKQPGAGPGWINAGIYILQRDVLAAIPIESEVSLERAVFPGLIGKGLHGHCSEGMFIDIGTPESYADLAAFARDALPERLDEPRNERVACERG